MLSACAVKEQPEGMEFGLEMPSAESGKVVIGQKTGEAYPLLWAKGDQIRVNGVLSAALSQAKAGGRSASFTLAGSVSAPYTVVHPASAWTSASLINFPAGSTAVLAAKSNNNTDVQLYNLTAYLRLRITRTDETPSFTKITFEGNGGEPVSGTFNVSYDAEGRPQLGEATQGQAKLTLQNPGDGGEYLLSLPAQTFAQGFTVRIFDSENRYMRLRTTASVTFSPGVITNAPAAAYTPNGMLLDGETPDGLDEDNTAVMDHVHTVMEMNQETPVLNSHAGYELESVLQPIYDYKQLLSDEFLLKGIDPETFPEQYHATYPRIKRLPDGSFILFYHGGETGSRVWYSRSADFKTWSEPVMLYKPYRISVVDPNDDWRRFVNPDAVVLPNGELLLVVSDRANTYYHQDMGCGLTFRRSADGGKTWGNPYRVEVGPNWEPYLLRLPDGTLHCYFSDAIVETWNSGTGLIVSTDDGYTWSSKIRCCQQYKYDYVTADPVKSQYNGQKLYTDQMPCFRVLNDGQTIVGFLEGRWAKPIPTDCEDKESYGRYYTMSIVRNHGFVWEDLTSYYAVKEGPADRETVVPTGGAGGYISTFPSGETVFSWTAGSSIALRLGNASATSFKGSSWTSDLYKPFEYNGYWACTEAWGGNYLASSVHAYSNGGYLGLQLMLFYLNQRLFAGSGTIDVDGSTLDWTTTRAFFVSAPSGEQAILRVCHDASKLYLLVEAVDDALTAPVNLRLSLGTTQKANLKLGPEGVISGAVSGMVSQTLGGTTLDNRQGWICEMSIPLSSLGASATSELRCYMDVTAGGKAYPFEGATSSSTSAWQRIKLK